MKIPEPSWMWCAIISVGELLQKIRPFMKETYSCWKQFYTLKKLHFQITKILMVSQRQYQRNIKSYLCRNSTYCPCATGTWNDNSLYVPFQNKLSIPLGMKGCSEIYDILYYIPCYRYIIIIWVFPNSKS